MIRYGLIGAGMMGQEHIRNVSLLDGVTITAVADPDETMRLAAMTTAHAQGFERAEALIASDLCDAYLIAAPNDLHDGLLRQVLATDLPVLVEKPLATTSAACRDLIALADGRSAPVWVAMEYRYMPPMQRLATLLKDGVAGPPRMVSIREHRFPFLRKVGDWNRFSARSGGTLIEKCCHFWDLMRLLLGSDPVRVYASGGGDVNHGAERYGAGIPDILDNAYVVVEFANGTRGMLDLCMFAEGSQWQEQVAVTGPEARIEAFVPGPARFSPDGQPRDAEIVTSIRATKQQIREVVHTPSALLIAGDHHGSTYYQHERFRDLLRAGRGAPEVSMMDGLWSVLVGEAAEVSARTGQAVALPGSDR